MTPEIARILRTLSPPERAMYLAQGGTLPPLAPVPLWEWRATDKFQLTRLDAKKIRKRKEAA